jgi:hypothetical protein
MSDFPKEPQEQAERTVSLHEGAISRQVPWLLSESQGVEVVDLEIDEIGIRSRRRGARSFGGKENNGLPGGLHGYNDANYDQFLLGVWGNRFYNSDADGGWQQLACGVSLIDGLLHQIVPARHNANLAWCACTCEQTTEASLGLNGRSQLVVFDVASDVATAVSLAPRTIASFQNRLFFAEEELIGWTEIGDLAAYSDTNSLLVEPGVGGEVTALLPARDIDPRMWIFKEDAIFLFTPKWGTDSAIIPSAGDALDTINSSIRILTRDIGCIATLSPAWIPGAEQADVFFLARDGVRSLTRAENDVQTGAGFPISYNIPTWINRINFTMAHKAVGAVFDNAYHLAVPMDGAKDNTHVLRYDIANKAWSLFNWEARALSNFRLANEDRLWMLNTFPTTDTSVTDGITDVSEAPYQVYSLYNGDIDPSTSITLPKRPGYMEVTKSYQFKQPLVKKRWDSFGFMVSSGETSFMEIAYRSDQGGWNVLTEAYIKGTSSTVILGEDALPWESSEDSVRRQTYSLSDIPPSYGLQFRVMSVSDLTETGRLKVYFTEVKAKLKTDKVENDE